MQSIKILSLVMTYVAVSCFANVAYRLSVSGGIRNLLTWQVIANIVGFLGVISLSWLYKLIPLHIAFPLTQALLIVTIQVIAARLIFKEQITLWQWLGTGFIVIGIFLITLRPQV